MKQKFLFLFIGLYMLLGVGQLNASYDIVDDVVNDDEYADINVDDIIDKIDNMQYDIDNAQESIKNAQSDIDDAMQDWT